MKISVIIPAYQEEKYIANCLEHLKQQDFTDYEIIVVANGCTDKTAEIARQYKKVKVVEVPEPHVSKARNLGAKKAKGEILIFMDADLTVPSHLLSTVFNLMEKKKFVGSVSAQPSDRKLINKFWFLARNALFYSRIYPGCNGLIISPKNTFEQTGGFNENLTIFEDGSYLRKAKKLLRYYFITGNPVKVSTRRYQKGRWCLFIFWVNNWLKKWTNRKLSDYEALR